MFQHFAYIRFLFFIFILSKIINFVSSESILLCYGDNYKIKCQPENTYIIIKNATFGYFYSIRKPNVNQTQWCTISNKNIKQNCGISLLKTIGSQCSGKISCTLDVIYSQYLPKDVLYCPELGAANHLLNLYIDYECIQKDILYDLGEVKKIQFVGGYITSVGYLFSKSSDNEDLEATAKKFKSENLLPLQSSFRPSTQLENRIRLPIVFQFQILENTLNSYQNNSHLSNFTNTCQIGKPYFQDYYAFNPDRYAENNKKSDKAITFCQSSTNLIGKVYQMINVTEVFITINVNFSNLSNLKSNLLIKFSAIFCPFFNVMNAKIVYDNKIIHSHDLKVNVFAEIICNPGYFLISPTNNSKEVSKIIICDHDKGMWEESTIPKECVNKFPTVSFTSSNTIAHTTSSIDSSSKEKNTVSSKDNLFTTFINNTFVPISMTTIKKAGMSVLTKWFLSIAIVIFIGLVIFGIICFKRKENMKCISKNCTSFTKIFTKKESIIMLNHINTYPNAKYQHVTDSGTPMSGSLGYIGHGFLSNGICRQSNRTLTTRVDSRPTMNSRDSFPNSNNLSDFDMRQIHHEDELPTKVPKQSPIMRILRSASSLRNHSLGVFGQRSLSRQSFNDQNSNFSDSRYSNSQMALLKGRRNNVTSEFIDPIMWTSDISPSKTMPKYKLPYKRDSEFSNNSQSDVSLKFNPKVYSPTVDTYLEPTPEISNQHDEEDSTQFPSQNKRKKSEDYMIYDHSRISSNNIDFTCPSSVTESGSEVNPNENEENKRFSMISNNYYGLQPSDSNAKYHSTRINNPIIERNNNNSTESVYESIDDDPIYRSTLERRKMALPPPPNE